MASCAVVSSTWQVLPFLLLYAPGYGGAYPLRPAIQGEYFGRRSFGAIQGVLLGVNAFAAMLGPVFAGWMYDTTGSYRVAFGIMAALAACSVPLVLLMRRPGPVHQPLRASQVG